MVCRFNSFVTEVLIMKKPVHWFAEQTITLLRSQIIGFLKLFWSKKILVSTLNIIGGIFCVVNGQKYDNLKQFNTDWSSTSLRTWFWFCFSPSCACYDLTVIKKNHTLNYHWFLQQFLLKTQFTDSLLATAVAQFTTKTTNS